MNAQSKPVSAGMDPRLVLGTIVLVAMLIGGNFSALKFALDHSTPVLIAGLRTVIGGTFLVALALFRGEKIPRDRRDLLNIFIVGLSITTISSGLLVVGVNKVPAGVASLIASTMPLFTALLSVGLLKSKISRLGGIGLAIGFTGTVVLASPSMSGSAATIGIVTLLCSAIAWAFGTVYMKIGDFSRVSPIMLVGIQLWMSAVMLIPVALLIEGSADTEWGLGLFVPLLYAAVPANAVTFALLATVVRHATPSQAASSAYLIPVFGVLFGWILRGEGLGLIEIVGAILVITGVYLLVTANSRTAAALAAADA